MARFTGLFLPVLFKLFVVGSEQFAGDVVRGVEQLPVCSQYRLGGEQGGAERDSLEQLLHNELLRMMVLI